MGRHVRMTHPGELEARDQSPLSCTPHHPPRPLQGFSCSPSPVQPYGCSPPRRHPPTHTSLLAVPPFPWSLHLVVLCVSPRHLRSAYKEACRAPLACLSFCGSPFTQHCSLQNSSASLVSVESLWDPKKAGGAAGITLLQGQRSEGTKRFGKQGGGGGQRLGTKGGAVRGAARPLVERRPGEEVLAGL